MKILSNSTQLQQKRLKFYKIKFTKIITKNKNYNYGNF